MFTCKNHVLFYQIDKSLECSLGSDQVPMGCLATSMMQSSCVPPYPSNKRRIFIHCTCVVIAYLYSCLLSMLCPYACLCAWMNIDLLCGRPLLDILVLCLLDAMLLPQCIEMLVEQLTSEFVLTGLRSRLTQGMFGKHIWVLCAHLHFRLNALSRLVAIVFASSIN